MFRVLVGALGALALAWAAAAQVTPFPGDFRTQEITTDDGATLHIRAGGQGPAVVLLHGFGDTGDMWAPLAAALARDHTVVVPDLRGMGLSSHPADGYDKRTQAADVRAILTHLGIDRAAMVGHDIGTMVAYAYAARYPDKTEKLVVMDAPVPGIPPWDDLVRHPLLWHFSFGGPDAERLVEGCRGQRGTYLRPNLYMQGLLNFRQSIQEQSASFAAAGDARISTVDVRDVADVAVAALTTAQHDNQSYALTGPEALTFTEMAYQLSRAVGRPITFVNVPPKSMRAALANLGFPAWQADGLLEEFAMYRRGEAAEVEPGVRDALGRPPRAFAEFARDYAPLFA